MLHYRPENKQLDSERVLQCVAGEFRSGEAEKSPNEGVGESKSTVSVCMTGSAIDEERKVQKDLEKTDPCPMGGAARDEDQQLDLLALADLQSLVKPKFRFHGNGERNLNVFKSFISNTASEEREAVAHESRVIVPGSCSFFIADMSKFRILLKRKCTGFEIMYLYFSILRSEWSNSDPLPSCLVKLGRNKSYACCLDLAV